MFHTNTYEKMSTQELKTTYKHLLLNDIKECLVTILIFPKWIFTKYFHLSIIVVWGGFICFVRLPVLFWLKGIPLTEMPPKETFHLMTWQLIKNTHIVHSSFKKVLVLTLREISLLLIPLERTLDLFYRKGMR